MGLFSDEKEVSMQITYNDKPEVEAYELRCVMAKGVEFNDELKNYFKLHAVLISTQIFDKKPTHIIFTDDRFDETKMTFKSDE